MLISCELEGLSPAYDVSGVEEIGKCGGSGQGQDFLSQRVAETVFVPSRDMCYADNRKSRAKLLLHRPPKLHRRAPEDILGRALGVWQNGDILAQRPCRRYGGSW